MAEKALSFSSESDIFEIRRKYKNVRLGIVLANNKEYENYLSEFVAQNKFRCTDFKKINAFFTEDGIKATYFCPTLSTVYPEYFVDMQKIKLPIFHDDLLDTGICPVAKQASNFKSENLHHICRFYKLPLEKVTLTNTIERF